MSELRIQAIKDANSRKIRAIHIITDEVLEFNSQVECAAAIGCLPPAVSRAKRTGGKVKNYRFEEIEG